MPKAKWTQAANTENRSLTNSFLSSYLSLGDSERFEGGSEHTKVKLQYQTLVVLYTSCRSQNFYSHIQTSKAKENCICFTLIPEKCMHYAKEVDKCTIYLFLHA
jgi:hypothetical protein